MNLKFKSFKKINPVKTPFKENDTIITFKDIEHDFSIEFIGIDTKNETLTIKTDDKVNRYEKNSDIAIGNYLYRYTHVSINTTTVTFKFL